MTHPEKVTQCPACAGHQLKTTAQIGCLVVECLDELRVGCRWGRAVFSAEGGRW